MAEHSRERLGSIGDLAKAKGWGEALWMAYRGGGATEKAQFALDLLDVIGADPVLGDLLAGEFRRLRDEGRSSSGALTCAYYVARGLTCARPVGHDKDPSSLHWHPDVDPASRCDYRGDCLKDAGHRSAHLYLARGTVALAGLLRRAVEEGTARVAYTREPGRLEHWWLQVDRTRVSADERDLLDSFVPTTDDEDRDDD